MTSGNLVLRLACVEHTEHSVHFLQKNLNDRRVWFSVLNRNHHALDGFIYYRLVCELYKHFWKGHVIITALDSIECKGINNNTNFLTKIEMDGEKRGYIAAFCSWYSVFIWHFFLIYWVAFNDSPNCYENNN